MVELHKIIISRKDSQLEAVLGFCDHSVAMLEACQQEFLHEKELIYLNKHINESSKEAFLRSRYVVKQALATYSLKESANQMYVENGVFQQPILSAFFNYQLAISISHHKSMAACLIFPEQHPMGVDLERLSLGMKDHVQTQVTDAERKLYRRMFEAEEVFFTRLWTIKEALSKVLKTGMMAPFSLFEVETIDYADNHTISYYKHFMQYKAISFTTGGNVCSVVLPRESFLSFPEHILAEKIYD